jgi:hypothetical protein
MTVKFGNVPRSERGAWITVQQGDYFPDILEPANLLYLSVFERFRDLLKVSSSSADLYRRIMAEPGKVRGKLIAVFRRYVTDISTEVLGKLNQVEDVIRHQGSDFRPVLQVKERFEGRPFPDEALAAILYLNSQRGISGYSFTDLFFEWFETTFGERFKLSGPRMRGRDLNLKNELSAYPKQTKADFLIRGRKGYPLVVGFARYDAHRGGSQEDDRIKGNNDNLTDIIEYSKNIGHPVRVFFLNDGPGLLAGSMWKDYSDLEDRWVPNVIVATFKMLPERLTAEWIEGS